MTILEEKGPSCCQYWTNPSWNFLLFSDTVPSCFLREFDQSDTTWYCVCIHRLFLFWRLWSNHCAVQCSLPWNSMMWDKVVSMRRFIRCDRSFSPNKRTVSLWKLKPVPWSAKIRDCLWAACHYTWSIPSSRFCSTFCTDSKAERSDKQMGSNMLW